MNPTIGSYFAGIGGICKGFQDAGFKIVYANEMDPKCVISYKHNHPNINLFEQDIYDLDLLTIPYTDGIVGGFPCQPFSVAGNLKGLKDIRSNVFFRLSEIIELKKPKFILLENVSNLLNINNGRDFGIIKDTLESIGYNLKYKVLSSNKHANIPQSRDRLFIVGFLDSEKQEKFKFPDEIPLITKVVDIVDQTVQQNPKYYYDTTSQYYNQLNTAIDDSKTVYQIRRIYVRKNKSYLCPTLTANMGGGGHNVPIIKDNFGIRKLTPSECFSFQGYNNFKIIVSDTNAYKQAGNSVTVPLIERIANNIMEIL
jgi:DNA (cytosine-5)-methyltransferase 1